MNIWSLDKPSTIKHLLLTLEEHFGKESFRLVEPEATNPLSIRIAPCDATNTLYIYAYGQRQGHFGLHLELPQGSDASLEESYDDLPYAHLIEVISLYL